MQGTSRTRVRCGRCTSVSDAPRIRPKGRRAAWHHGTNPHRAALDDGSGREFGYTQFVINTAAAYVIFKSYFADYSNQEEHKLKEECSRGRRVYAERRDPVPIDSGRRRG